MLTDATTGLPPPRVAVTFALWGNAVLDGRTSLDEAAAMIGAGRPRRVAGVPGEPGPTSLPVALGRLRGAGARAFSLALPVPGDPLGLGGPRAFNEAAIAAGQAVLVPDLRFGLLPVPAGDDHPTGVHWQVWTELAEPPQPESLGSASRALREAVVEAAGALTDLEAPPTPGVAPGEPSPALRTPPGLDARAYELLDRAERLLTAVRAALADPAVTTSAGLDTRRRHALVPVERAARRALAAACHPALVEPGRP